MTPEYPWNREVEDALDAAENAGPVRSSAGLWLLIVVLTFAACCYLGGL